MIAFRKLCIKSQNIRWALLNEGKREEKQIFNKEMVMHLNLYFN